MVSRHSGHFVQIWRPLGARTYAMPKPKRPNWRTVDHPNYVEVEGRVIQRTVAEYPYYALDGWFYVSRELDKRRAKFYAKAYKRAGFKTRILFVGNDGSKRVVR